MQTAFTKQLNFIISFIVKQKMKKKGFASKSWQSQ